jgi:hypothetical protein
MQKGPFRDLNPGPPAPKSGIIPLDQTDYVDGEVKQFTSIVRGYVFRFIG